MIDLRYSQIRAILRETGLDRLERIGKGSFCAVYAQGDSVFKLTVDEGQHGFYTAQFDNPVFPKLIKDHGQVGVFGQVPVMLLEMEKLTPIPKGSFQSKFVGSFIQRFNERYPAHGEWASDTVCHAEALTLMSDERSFSHGLRHGLLDLADYVLSTESISDFHRGNFMLRGNQIVLNDPVSKGVIL